MYWATKNPGITEERAVSLPEGVNVVCSVFQRVSMWCVLSSRGWQCGVFCLPEDWKGHFSLKQQSQVLPAYQCYWTRLYLPSTFCFMRNSVLFGGWYATTLKQWWQIFSPLFIFLLGGQGIVSTQITPQSINFGLL